MKLIVLLLCVASAAVMVPSTLRAAQQSKATVTTSPAVNQSETDQLDSLVARSRRLVNQEQYEEAIQTSEQALALSERIGAKPQQLRASNLLAAALFRTGRSAEAIHRLKESAAIAELSNDINGQALALARAGSLLATSGLYEESLYCFNPAIALFRQANNRVGEVVALSRFSSVYSSTGDLLKARQLLQYALTVARELHDKGLDETLLLKLGIVERDSRNYEEALKLGLQALALDSDQTDVRPGSAPNSFDAILAFPQSVYRLTRLELLHHLGIVSAALNDHPKAEVFLERALAVARQVQRPQFEAYVMGDLAGSQLKLGKTAESRASAVQAIALLRQSGGSKHWESRFLYYLAEANRALGRNDEALSSYREAIAAIEQARSLSIPTEISRAGIVSARHNVFAGAIDFFLSLGREEEALEIAEAWHARAFLDILAESRIDATSDLSAAYREREDRLFERKSGIQRELWKSGLSEKRERELRDELAAAENELESFQLEMRRTNPRYASLKYPQPISPARIAKELIDSDTALIEYVVSEKKSFAWVVRQGKISSVVLPGQRAIEELLAGYRTALSERASALTVGQSINKLNAKGREIYRILFQPIEGRLGSARRLVIVPDGVLSYLPFETLVTDSTQDSNRTGYLLERFSIAYIPSASALSAINTRQTGSDTRGLIAFGDPVYANADLKDAESKGAFDFRNLPYARTEVNEIGSLFSSADRRIFLGEQAIEEALKSEPLERYRFVHFATHGVIDEERPERSGILLSTSGEAKEDGVLQMNEVMRLRLNADLVTLSACRTGLGKLVGGEGLIGLTRSFLYAGASSVVVSLWNVNDMATAALMRPFYAALKDGLSKDEALRAAKLQLLRGQKRAWRHPYFWASFVLNGERKPRTVRP